MTGRFSSLVRVSIIAVALSLSVASCQLGKNQLTYDRAAEADRQNFRDAMAPIPTIPNSQVATPEFQSVITTPNELKMPSPLVTVSVNQTVSLRDLMYQLAEQADVDLELDPQIHGSIIFTAKDRPFDQVIDRITEMAGLRYDFTNGVLRVELDRPFLKNYDVGFLNVERKGETSINTTSSSSTSTTSNKVENDLWKELNDGLEQVLSASDTYVSLATLSDPVAQAVNPLPPPMVSADPNVPPPPPPLPGSPEVAPIPASQAPTLQITTPQGAPMVPSPPSTFTVSEQTGVVSVFCSARQHKIVAKFVNAFRKRVSTQVLIEAKILQVDLNDEYATGIDWGALNLTGLLQVNGSFPLPSLSSAPAATFGFTFKPGNDFNTAVNAISRFGTVRALSSPRVTVLNNQPAIVNVTRDNVYFNFQATTTPSTTAGVAPTVSLSSEQRNAPEGVILAVIPTANADTGEITLTLRPTVSKVVNRVADPTLTLQLAIVGVPIPAGLTNNNIPELSVQEIDSILHMQSGQMMAMGGLMKDENTVTQEGVPILGDVPYIGGLFRSHVDLVRKSELVVLVRAHIISGENLDEIDKKLYKNLSLDRHPGPM
ncbi:MAG: bacterial type and secretion system family protein [Alphaproteobacteria bacterium]|jgi:general secretion pathway protein D|nr:bacterial type and secretion system family protein [Alphaproteobacteria bacterium]